MERNLWLHTERTRTRLKIEPIDPEGLETKEFNLHKCDSQVVDVNDGRPLEALDA